MLNCMKLRRITLKCIYYTILPYAAIAGKVECYMLAAHWRILEKLTHLSCSNMFELLLCAEDGHGPIWIVRPFLAVPLQTCLHCLGIFIPKEGLQDPAEDKTKIASGRAKLNGICWRDLTWNGLQHIKVELGRLLWN